MKTVINRGTFLFLVIWFPGVFFGCSHRNDLSDAYGNFEATDRMISSQAAGKLWWFTAAEGDKLAMGDTVGLVDTIALSLKKASLTVNMERVRANAAGLTAKKEVLLQQLQNLKVEQNRVADLFAGKAATQKQLDEINGKVKVTELQIREINVQRQSVLKELDVIRAEMATLDEQIAKCFVVNPAAGTVLEKYAEDGEIVIPGKTLYKLADLTTMFLRVYVDETMLSDLRTGGAAEVLIDKPHGMMDTLAGKISWISDEAEFTPKIIQTRKERVNLVYAVKIRVENDGRLKIGMPGEANFR
ncbi:MAG: HlyD family efflux transporter periplasmic adaptor subunit [Chlorobi bacterium]|nr:HlyD family efflux transporter periplasmic adaptor subunit [Chlorobiota bacterium]